MQRIQLPEIDVYGVSLGPSSCPEVLEFENTVLFRSPVFVGVNVLLVQYVSSWEHRNKIKWVIEVQTGLLFSPQNTLDGEIEA